EGDDITGSLSLQPQRDCHVSRGAAVSGVFRESSPECAPLRGGRRDAEAALARAPRRALREYGSDRRELGSRGCCEALLQEDARAPQRKRICAAGGLDRRRVRGSFASLRSIDRGEERAAGENQESARRIGALQR